MCAPQRTKEPLTPFTIASNWDAFFPAFAAVLVGALAIAYALYTHAPDSEPAPLAEDTARVVTPEPAADVDCTGTTGTACTAEQAARAKAHRELDALAAALASIAGPIRTGSVALRPIYSTGPRSDAELPRQTIFPQRESLEARCLERVSPRTRVHGWLKAIANVTPEGRVVGVRIVESTIDDVAVARCVEDGIAEERFAALGTARSKSVAYVFAL